jgi:hypothetical protein
VRTGLEIEILGYLLRTDLEIGILSIPFQMWILEM